MARQNVFDMKLSKLYTLLTAKAIKKGRSKAEVDRVISWLTGWDMSRLDMEMPYGDFLANAPAYCSQVLLLKLTFINIDPSPMDNKVFDTKTTR
ncbi:DUF2200 family protein [Oribacterium sp. HCP28S3_H8]|uniref:DUF2200 family protein n=1 Tax=Oribacterium sp. HCP28S3_H8 TaxID=3438945 RepID=UPI003F8ABBE6